METAIYGLGALGGIALPFFFFFYPKKKIQAFAFLAIGLLSFATAFALYWNDSSKSPITVSPENIVFKTENLATKEQIKIYNRTDDFLYQVWVRISPENKNFDPSNINLEILSKPEQNLPLGERNFSTFIYRIKGEDSNGSISTYLVVDYLEPKKSYIFEIQPKNNEEKIETKLHIELISFSNEPNVKGVNRQGMSSFSMNPPVDIKLHSISIFIE